MFDERRYTERVIAGELFERVKRDRPAPASSGQPLGTRSQILAIVDSAGTALAIVHRYLRPDGSLGGPQGEHDPKWMRIGQETLIPSHDDTTVCQECEDWRRRARIAQQEGS